MKNLKKKLSAVVLTAVFATMQVSMANPIDTGLGTQNGGAVINNTTGGFAGLDVGTNSATLNFNGDTHVNWNTLNVDKGETLNFNAVNGANGLTVLNTVNQGMTNVYGQINANSGIGKLIISNPNGVLFDGAKFTTAGDALITTQQMTATFNNGIMDVAKVPTTANVDFVTIKDSNISVGGEFHILTPSVNVVKSTIKANDGVKFVTANGQDYLSVGNAAPKQAVRLESVNIDGDVYIVSDKGAVATVGGGEINGNLNIKSDDVVGLNFTDNGKILHVTGDVNAEGNGWAMYARNTKVDGNLNMENGGGFLEVGNVRVGENMNLKTVAKSENDKGYKHFVHVVGDTEVEGDVNIDSKDNIHIGNYNFEEKRLLDGNLKVGGDLTAHAHDGHVTTTINVQANKISYTSDNLNVLTDKDSVLTANEYEFSSNGYIGAIGDYEEATGTERIISVMENYTFIPKDLKGNGYTQIAGGKITKLDANGNAYILSKGDVTLTGANAQDINITAPNKRIDITGPDVHANNINVGNETNYLKVDFEGRDFTTNYTNIRDEKVVTIRPDEVITYDLADGGYNRPTLKPDTNTTYLIGPDREVPPPPDRVNPPDEPGRQIVQWVPEDVTKAPVNTPVAFAADLDDDEEGAPVRKNVDGSVTVVRAFPMGK